MTVPTKIISGKHVGFLDLFEEWFKKIRVDKEQSKTLPRNSSCTEKMAGFSDFLFKKKTFFLSFFSKFSFSPDIMDDYMSYIMLSILPD